MFQFSKYAFLSYIFQHFTNLLRSFNNFKMLATFKGKR